MHLFLLVRFIKNLYIIGMKVKCERCGKEFGKRKSYIERTKHNFCSHACRANTQNTKILVSCEQCDKKFEKLLSYIKRTKHNFCSNSCKAIYGNAHKTKGTRVSKLELYLQQELIKKYSFEIKFNSREEIGSELDFYIPSLKLGIEVNGILHYEPIYGPEKLARMENNDNRKFQACLEKGISLCIVNSSLQKTVNEKTSLPYLTKICEVIDSCIDNLSNRLDSN